MKRLYTFAVLMAMMGCGITSTAAPLTPQAALQRLNTSSATARYATVAAAPHLAYTLNDANEQPALYVFTSKTAPGFVIASGDDVAPPMLGYSTTDAFDANNIPCCMEDMLEQYAAEIQAARQAGATSWTKAPRLASNPDYPSIEPLCSTIWNQSSPYNLYCPEYSGSRSVTGCVATAMAQVLKAHNYPTKGKGSKSWTYNGVNMYFNFADTTFYWDRMLDSYSSSATVAQQQAVASLMYGCGVSVEMQYSPSASGAFSSDVPDALKNYFNYHASTKYLERASFDMRSWNDLLYQSLRVGLPVYLSGRNPTGGHAFVCDGYSSDNFFHINWGWGGTSNGYFLLTALDPSAQGIGGSSAGYNLNQGAIVMAQPNTSDAVQPYIIYANSSITPTLFESTLSFNVSLYNFEPVATTCYLGAKITAPNGDVTYVQQPTATTFASNGSKSNYSVHLPELTADGVYTVEPYINAGTEAKPDWRMIYTSYARTSKVMFVKQGSSLTVKDVTNEYSYPEGKSVKFYTSMYAGYPFEMSFRLNNYNETKELYGNVYVYLISSDGSKAVATLGPVLYDLLPGEETKYSFSTNWTNSPAAGKYLMCVGTSSNGYVVPFTDLQEVTIAEAPTGTPTLSASGFSPVSGLIYTDRQTFTANIKCTGGYFADKLIMFLFNSSNTYMGIGNYVDRQFIEPGQTKACTINTFWDLQPNTSYYAQLQAGSSYLGKVSFRTSTTVGIESVEEIDDFHIADCGNGYFAAVAPEAITSATIYSLDGMIKPAPVEINANHAEINAFELPAGIYIAKVATATGIYTQRIAKK